MNSDKIIYQAFRKGDISAFEELVIKHRHNLVYFIMQYLKNYHTSEDIAQEVFAYIYVNPDKYNSDYEFTTYLFMLAKRRAIDYLRKHGKQQWVSNDQVEVADVNSLEELIYQRENSRVLKDALKEMKEEYRMVIMLIDLNGLTLAEAALIMDKSLSSIKVLSHRAKKRLKQILEKGGNIYEV